MEIKERKELFSKVQIYLIENIGINVQPVSASFNKEKHRYNVKLRCVIPNEIDETKPTIIENAGYLVLDEDYRVIYESLLI